MKNNFILWVIISLIVMLALPWLAVSFVKDDAGMAVCFILFFAINPIYSVILGVFAGKKYKKVMGNACHFSSIIPAWFMDIF